MLDVVRAWKDPAYRSGLSAAELAGMPAHPAGAIDLTDTELDAVSGGMMQRSDLTSMLRTCTAGTESCCC